MYRKVSTNPFDIIIANSPNNTICFFVQLLAYRYFLAVADSASVLQKVLAENRSYSIVKEKSMVRKMFSLFSLLLIASLMLSACGSPTPQVQEALPQAPQKIKLVEWDYWTSGDGSEVWGGLLESCAKRWG
jgi:hypothetical protein